MALAENIDALEKAHECYRNAAESTMEHAVIVHLQLDDPGFGSAEMRESIYELQGSLTDAINKAKVGEFDGDDFGQGECLLFMYGPNADLLFDTVEPILKQSPHAKGGFAIKRYGEATDPRAREVKIKL
jgi:hypothetical protein